MHALFVIGTDTGVGKTVITGLLGRYFQEKKIQVVTQKWIQTGSRAPDDVYTHLRLMRVGKQAMRPYLSDMAPYIFPYAASAHLAARNSRRTISAARIIAAFKALSLSFDFVVVEGIGGALVPFNRRCLVIDIAAELKLPVLIVAHNKLGAINHTLLTIESVQKRHMPIVGVVMNTPLAGSHSRIIADNPHIVQALTNVPVLGTLIHSGNAGGLYRAFQPIGRRILAGLKRRGYA
jgi:dethiobiotin synthetase